LVASSRGYDPEEAFPKKIFFGSPEVGFFCFVRREKPKLSSLSCLYRCVSYRNTVERCKCTLKVTLYLSKKHRWHALHVLQYWHCEPCRFENRHTCVLEILSSLKRVTGTTTLERCSKRGLLN
jgi:hypothetical protein